MSYINHRDPLSSYNISHQTFKPQILKHFLTKFAYVGHIIVFLVCTYNSLNYILQICLILFYCIVHDTTILVHKGLVKYPICIISFGFAIIINYSIIIYVRIMIIDTVINHHYMHSIQTHITIQHSIENQLTFQLKC